MNTYQNDSSTYVKRYEVWAGNNHFLCNGRIFLGSHPTYAIITLILCIITPYLIWFIISFNYFNSLDIITSISLIYICIYYFIKTAITDPGIIPRINYPDEKAEIPPIPLDINNKPIKYCNTCHIYRINRAKHCKYCDNCVLRFDHHCFWLSNCIGLRNYPSFFIFLCSSSILSCYILIICLLYLLDRKVNDDIRFWWDKAIWIISSNWIIFYYSYIYDLCFLFNFRFIIISYTFNIKKFNY